MMNAAYSGTIPLRPDRSRHALERALDQLTHQKPRRVDRARHGRAPTRYALETAFAVIRLVTNQHDQAMAFILCLRERALDQHLPDAAVAEWRLDRERAKQQRLDLTDA